MATRLYLRAKANGYAPTDGEKSTALPVGTFQDLGGGVNDGKRSLSLQKGVAQASHTGSSLAQTAHQDWYAGRFSATPLLANITAQTWTLAIATSEGNAAGNAFTVCSLYVWRPSDSSVVGFVYDSDTTLGIEWSTTEDGQVVTFAGGAVTITAGDVLVLEVWRHAAQGMANSYTQQIYFDGATPVTDATTADAASYLETPQDGIITERYGAEFIILEPLTLFDTPPPALV